MTLRTLAVGVAVSAAAFGIALSQDGQKPPAEQLTQAEPQPAEQPKCVTSKTEWKQNGKAMRLAEALGGEAITIPSAGRRIADDLINFAHVRQRRIGRDQLRSQVEIDA